MKIILGILIAVFIFIYAVLIPYWLWNAPEMEEINEEEYIKMTKGGKKDGANKNRNKS